MIIEVFAAEKGCYQGLELNVNLEVGCFVFYSSAISRCSVIVVVVSFGVKVGLS